MYSIAKLSNTDRKDLFDAYAFQFNKRPEIVEKDFSSMKEMLNDDSVQNFDDLIKHLSLLENELNGILSIKK